LRLGLSSAICTCDFPIFRSTRGGRLGPGLQGQGTGAVTLAIGTEEAAMTQLLMPKATAVWLVDNTALSFEQIAAFCTLHPLEVKAIADGEAAQGIKGSDPIITGQLTRDEISRAEKDPAFRLRLAPPKVKLPEVKSKKGPRYTPVSRRQDRPNAILWLVRNHPELKDAALMRLVGTTKPTIAAIRDRTHWNSQTLTPMDPVTLGLCSQIDLDLEVNRAAKERGPVDTTPEQTLLPADQTTSMPSKVDPFERPEAPKREERYDAAKVFANLKSAPQDDE
jgi:hypothetical protein